MHPKIISLSSNLKSTPVIGLLLFITLTPFRVSGANEFLGLERKGELNLFLEFLILALFAILIFSNLMIYIKMGNTSIGKPFAYLIAGMSLLVLNRIFFVLIEFNQYQITPMTIHGWSHMLFYAGLFLLFLAISKVGERTKESNLSKINYVDRFIIAIFFVFAGFLFITVETYNMDFSKWFMGSMVHEYGLLHFSTFIILGLLIFQLANIKRNTTSNDFGQYVSPIIPMFIGFLSLMFVNHTWKYLTDEAIISVDIATVRLGEQSFWIVGFGMLTYGFLQVYNNVNLIARGFDVTPNDLSTSGNPITQKVLNVLSNHIGSIAPNIAIQSGNEIGIDVTGLKTEDLPNFAKAIQRNTRELIGDFPSRFLNQAIVNVGKSS